MACREFKKGKSKQLDIQAFEFNLEDNVFQLHRELKTKTYQHSDYTSFYITDPKLRHIHKACVKDRVLHQAIFRVLYPIFDKNFIFDSYSCRFNKGTHRAVTRLETFARKLSHNHTQNIFALKCDIKRFFDSVDRKILLEFIRKRIKDSCAMGLLEQIIGSFQKDKNRGIPLGNVTSQLFANIYLNELDQFIKHQLKVKYYIRYCDDFVILEKNKEYLFKLFDKINGFLIEQLKLYLHPGKIMIRKYRQGIDFLGYVARPHHRILRTKTKKRLMRRISYKNLSSYLGVLKHCKSFKIREKLFPPYFLLG